MIMHDDKVILMVIANIMNDFYINTANQICEDLNMPNIADMS